MDSKHAGTVTETAVTPLSPYLGKDLTNTTDNGKEFTWHEDIKVRLKTDMNFAHPYHSWERGLNENTKSLIRQYFTKGSSFASLT